MNFRTIKTNIITILNDNKGTDFEVLQAQRQNQGASDIESLGKVLVYFFSNSFSEDTGAVNGEVQSMPTFRIIIEVAGKATLTDESDPSTAVSAEIIADNKFDLLAEKVYQILMNGTRIDLLMPKGEVSNRYIKNIQKGDVNSEGEHAIIIGQMDITCMTPEQVPGDDGVLATDIKNELDIQGDTVQKSGVKILNP